MANVKIRGHDVLIDIREELEQFEWHRAKWSHDKLIAASPFRYDRSPSFFVNLEASNGYPAGTWGDSGAYDDMYKSGGITKLLAFLRNETYEETEEYLLNKYRKFSEHTEYLLIPPKLSKSHSPTKLSHDIIDRQVSPYLQKRGISQEVQSKAEVGKSCHYGFVSIPWLAPDGQLANVKYRATRGKTFFYESNARPIRELVFGANLYTNSTNDLIVCEAEIDALSWRTAGFNAVAVGGVAFTKQQADILRRLPFSRLMIAGDNDKAGARFNAQVIDAMKGRDLTLLQWRESDCKDANDVLRRKGVGALVEAYLRAYDLPAINVPRIG